MADDPYASENKALEPPAAASPVSIPLCKAALYVLYKPAHPAGNRGAKWGQEADCGWILEAGVYIECSFPAGCGHKEIERKPRQASFGVADEEVRWYSGADLLQLPIQSLASADFD